MYQKLERKITLLTQDAAQYLDFNTNWNYKNKHLVQIQLFISSNSIQYIRKSYSLTDIARDIGGLANVLLVFFT